MTTDIALLILDMQNDILAVHPRDHHLDQLIQTIADLAAWARKSKIPVLYSRVAFRTTYVDVMPGMAKMLKEKHLLDETQQGSEMIDALKPQPEDIVITRRRSSGFYGNDLEVVLRNLGTRKLLYTGMSTHRVVESTVREAHCRDFENIVVSDGCGAQVREFHDNALKSMADFFATVITASEVKKQFG